MTPPTPVSGLAPARATLDNGVVVIAKETRTTPAVAIHLAVRAGAVDDPADAPGTMHLLSRVIDRGTTSRSAAAIAEDLDSRGISLAVSVTHHQVSLVCTCLAEDFDPILELLGDIVIAPSFPPAEVSTRSAEVVTAIRQDEDNPAVRAVDEMMARLYPGHPYGARIKGRVEVVESLTQNDLVQLHATRFSPDALTAVIVGDVSESHVTGTMARVFGGWRAKPTATRGLPPVLPVTARQRLVVPMMGKAQTDIAYGFTGVTRADAQYYACWLMNNVFGQYSIGGRLGDSIREKQGMAYYVSSALHANLAEGPLTIRAGVSAANVDRALASIDHEIERLVSDGVTERELRESRQYLIGSMPRTLETNAGIAGFLQNAEFFGLGLDYDVRLPDLLGRVGLDDVRAAARRLLDPARATIVVAGPYAGT